MPRVCFVIAACLAGLASLPSAAAATPIVMTTDFILDNARSHFNGFEGIPNEGRSSTVGSGPYIEDNIRVEQFPEASYNIVSNFGISWKGFTGNNAWYAGGNN